MNKYTLMVSKNIDTQRIALEAHEDVTKLEYSINRIILPAFRYALGKDSYTINDFCMATSKNINSIEKANLVVIMLEAKEHINKSPLEGLDSWKKLVSDIENHLKAKYK